MAWRREDTAGGRLGGDSPDGQGRGRRRGERDQGLVERSRTQRSAYRHLAHARSNSTDESANRLWVARRDLEALLRHGRSEADTAGFARDRCPRAATRAQSKPTWSEGPSTRQPLSGSSGRSWNCAYRRLKGRWQRLENALHAPPEGPGRSERV